MDDDDPKLSRFALISPEDYHCQVISRSKSVSLSTLYVRALMQKVQPSTGYSVGMTSWFAMKFSAHWVSVLLSLKEIHLLDLLLKSDWCAHHLEVAPLRLQMKCTLIECKL